MRFVRAALAAAAIAFAAPAVAQQTPAAVAALFEDVAASPARALVEAKHWFGDLGPHTAALTGYIAAAFAEPAFVPYAMREAPPGAHLAAWLARDVSSVGRQAGGLPYGLDRLGTADQLAYLDYLVAYIEWVSAAKPAACPVLGASDPDDPATLALEAAFRATRPAAAVETDLAVMLSAFRATVSDTPPVNAFTEVELDRGQATYLAAMRAAPGGDRLFAAMEEGLDISPAETCLLLRLTVTVLRDLPERERSFALQLAFAGGIRIE